MAEVDIQVILNELKHIRQDLQDIKDEKVSTRLSVLEMQIKIMWASLPLIGGVIGWLTGGGWQLFVGKH